MGNLCCQPSTVFNPNDSKSTANASVRVLHNQRSMDSQRVFRVIEFPLAVFSDLTLEYADTRFRVHRLVLAQQSAVFREALTNGGDYKCTHVSLNGRSKHSVQGLESLLNQIYALNRTDIKTETKRLDKITAQQILPLADFYDCTELLRLCYAAHTDRSFSVCFAL